MLLKIHKKNKGNIHLLVTYHIGYIRVSVEMHNQYVCHVDNWVQMSKMENSFFGCVSCEGEPFEEFIKKG